MTKSQHPSTSRNARVSSRRGIIVPVCLAALLVGSACGGATNQSESASEGTLTAIYEDTFPFDSAADWVSFADFVAVVTVESEELLEPERSDLERGEYSLGNRQTLAIEEVLWSGLDGTSPSSVDIWGSGYWVNDQETRRLVPESGRSLVTDSRYVVALVNMYPFDSESWGLYTIDSFLELTDRDTLGAASIAALHGRLLGPSGDVPVSTTDLASILESTSVHDGVDRATQPNPQQRFDAWAAENAPVDPYAKEDEAEGE